MNQRSPSPAQPAAVELHAATCEHSDLRCACGSLLARRVGDAVELKCRRCKRTVLIPFEMDPGSPLG